MKRKCLAVGIILLFFGTTFIPTTAWNNEKSSSASRGHWLYVGGNGPGNYSTILAALENASDDDTIYVYPGIYNEGTICINISVSLIGQSNITTTINHSTFIFNTRNIFLTEFCFRNYSGIIIAPQSGNGNNVSHDTVTNAIFTDGSSGITIGNSSYNMIINNHFDECGIFLSTFLDPFTPIDTDHLTNTILDNTVNEKPLIYLEDAHNHYISEAGEIILLRCKNITITQISFCRGLSLLEFIDTTTITVTNNDFNNTVIFFINSSENTVTDSRFYTQFDEYGTNGLIFLNQCKHNEITNNVFSYQSMIFIFMSSDNSFKHNDFYHHLRYRPMIVFMDADNTWQGNFWMRGRILPKLIFGYTNASERSLDIDWRPALKPNNPTPLWLTDEMNVNQRMHYPWIQFDSALSLLVSEDNQ